MPRSSMAWFAAVPAIVTPFAMRLEIVDPPAEVKPDVGMRRHRVDQNGLQIAAMDHPVGCAVALLGRGTERCPRQDAGGRASS